MKTVMKPFIRVVVNRKDIYDRTRLYRAVHCTKAEPVSVLLQCGVDVHTLDQDGKIALDSTLYWIGKKQYRFWRIMELVVC